MDETTGPVALSSLRIVVVFIYSLLLFFEMKSFNTLGASLSTVTRRNFMCDIIIICVRI